MAEKRFSIMKKILALIMALGMSVCMFSCGDSEENSTGSSSVSESSAKENSKETVSPDSFASTGYSKANEITVILDSEGVEIPKACIYSTDTSKNFNMSDELYERIGKELKKYTEMETSCDYFLVIQNYACSCFVCTNGTDTGIKNTSGITAEGSYDEMYQSVYNEISAQ